MQLILNIVNGNQYGPVWYNLKSLVNFFKIDWEQCLQQSNHPFTTLNKAQYLVEQSCIRYNDINISHRSTLPMCKFYCSTIFCLGISICSFSLADHLCAGLPTEVPIQLEISCTAPLHSHCMMVIFVLASTHQSLEPLAQSHFDLF